MAKPPSVRPQPLVLALVLMPVIVGVLGTIAPSIGLMTGTTQAPAGPAWTLAPWRSLLSTPGLDASVILSARIGLLSTGLSLTAAVVIAAGTQGTALMRWSRRTLPPLLAVPHVAVALGLAFLLAPSGWIVRLLSPWATGWTLPPDLPTAPDPWGLTAVLALTVKETPYLLLMLLAALPQVDAERTLRVARSLGHGPLSAWTRVVLPRLWPFLRLPVYAVLAYGLSVVDVALVLAPTTPPPLAVAVTRWLLDPDSTTRLQGAAGAMLQTLLVIAAIGGWHLGERLIWRLARPWLTLGPPSLGSCSPGRPPRRLGPALAVAVALPGIALTIGAALAMALWSIADTWFWPAPWPSALSLETWRQHLAVVGRPLGITLSVGLTATLLATGLAVALLRTERHGGTQRASWLIYLPLLVPQVGFLHGVTVLATRLDLDGTWIGVTAGHLLFVLPYVYLSLAGPWHRLDPRWSRVAAVLGAPPARVLTRVILPLLLRPTLFAMAVGFAVSVTQYLPTLFLGSGLHPTLTTEAVALAAGGDRRIIGVHIFLQAALPLVGFGLAVAIPSWLHRNRRGLRTADGLPTRRMRASG